MDTSSLSLRPLIYAAVELTASRALHFAGPVDRVCSFLTGGWFSAAQLDARAPARLQTAITASGMLGASVTVILPRLLPVAQSQGRQLGWALLREPAFPRALCHQIRVINGNGYLGGFAAWSVDQMLSNRLVQRWARDATCGPAAVSVAKLAAGAMSLIDGTLSYGSLSTMSDAIPLPGDPGLHPFDVAEELSNPLESVGLRSRTATRTAGAPGETDMHDAALDGDALNDDHSPRISPAGV